MSVGIHQRADVVVSLGPLPRSVVDLEVHSETGQEYPWWGGSKRSVKWWIRWPSFGKATHPL